MADSSLSKLRKRALDLIRLGDKVFHYRRDLIPASDIETLKNNTQKLEQAYRSREPSEVDMERAIRDQHDILVKTGGAFYPNRFLSENVETALVVAIVIVAFRIFFFQPFVIPTNSMYPTYSGMQWKTYAAEESAPNLLQKVAIKLLKGGTHYGIHATTDGEISIPVNPRTGTFQVNAVKGTNWFILPAVKHEYTLYVGNQAHTVVVPPEFRLDPVLIERFEDGEKRYFRAPDQSIRMGTGIHVKKGEPILQFDVLMGDALFVNRMWYHFVRPKSGDAFVFRTETFMNRSGFPETVGEDKFYIKRLVGEPGQTLHIEESTLMQDGKPAVGAKAFARNAERDGFYPGYQKVGLLAEGQSYTVPQDQFFAMGDNSANSKDSRYFGPVPKEEVIGVAAFIYYPFSIRWGRAQ